MRKKHIAIPVNLMATEFGEGISVERLSIQDTLITDKRTVEAGNESHRHDSHSFFLLERGRITVEIDFQTYNITAPSTIYIHPDHVVTQHRSLPGIRVQDGGQDPHRGRLA